MIFILETNIDMINIDIIKIIHFRSKSKNVFNKDAAPYKYADINEYDNSFNDTLPIFEAEFPLKNFPTSLNEKLESEFILRSVRIIAVK